MERSSLVSIDSQEVPRQLPDYPNLRHLKDQAKDLLKAGGATSITDAQFKIARLYGFSSWPKLKAHVNSIKEIGRLKQAIDGLRIPMMELLVSHGADVNAEWKGDFPILFAPCESVDPAPLNWLLERGDDPNRGNRNWANTALDYLICTYARSSRLSACIDLILEAGGKTKYDAPGVLELLRGRIERLAEQLDADRELV